MSTCDCTPYSFNFPMKKSYILHDPVELLNIQLHVATSKLVTASRGSKLRYQLVAWQFMPHQKYACRNQSQWEMSYIGREFCGIHYTCNPYTLHNIKMDSFNQNFRCSPFRSPSWFTLYTAELTVFMVAHKKTVTVSYSNGCKACLHNPAPLDHDHKNS